MIQEGLKKLLTDVVGVDIEQLTTGLASEEEVEVKFIGELYTEDQLNSAKEAVQSSGKTEWKKTGVEMAVKKAREELGLEFEGKTMKNLTEALATKTLADAKIEPDKQLKEKKESLERLQAKYDTDLDSKENEILGLKSEVNNFKTNSKLSGYLPDKLQGVSQKQVITLLKSDGYEFETNEDNIFVGKLNGKVVKDPTEKPVPVDQVILDYAKSNNWLEGIKGRDGKHQLPTPDGKFKSMDDKYKYMEENKINPMSPEGVKIVDAPLEK